MTDRGHDHGDRSCMALFEKLSEYIDGELHENLRARVESHMDDCTPCRGFLESLERSVRLVGAERELELPDGLRREILAAAARLGGGSGS